MNAPVAVGNFLGNTAAATVVGAQKSLNSDALNRNAKTIETRINAAGASFAKDSNHSYQVHIVSATNDLTKPITSITAFLPEEISLDITANYTAPFGEGMFDASGVRS